MAAFGLSAENGADPAETAVEWGVRRMGQRLTIRMRSGSSRAMIGDFFPAYDDDGGTARRAVAGDLTSPSASTRRRPLRRRP